MTEEKDIETIAEAMKALVVSKFADEVSFKPSTKNNAFYISQVTKLRDETKTLLKGIANEGHTKDGYSGLLETDATQYEILNVKTSSVTNKDEVIADNNIPDIKNDDKGKATEMANSINRANQKTCGVKRGVIKSLTKLVGKETLDPVISNADGTVRDINQFKLQDILTSWRRSAYATRTQTPMN